MSVAQLGLWAPPAMMRDTTRVEVAPAFELRPYQRAADEAIDRELAKHRSTLVIMATGTGKTVLFSSQARKRGGALVLAHRDSLIKQAARKLQKETGEYVAIEKAERTAFASPYICASVQTLKGRRLEDFAARFKDTVRLIVIDEAHRATSPSYRKIFEAFPDAQLLGVTATGDRTDGVGMGTVFDSEAFRYDIDQATDDGWLTPHKFIPVFCSANLDKVKVKGAGENRDFDQAQLDDAIATMAGETARALMDQCGDKRLIVFTPGVKTAHATAGALNKLRPGCAAAVDGTMDDDDKARAEAAHQAGDVQHLINCGVYTEGYDDPSLDGIFDSAPTKSRTRAAQKWGRPNRLVDEAIGKIPTADGRKAAIANSRKPWALVFDLTCNSDVHSPICPADILIGRATDEERTRVKAKMKGKGGDVRKTLDEVRAEMKAEERERAARAAALAARRISMQGRPRTIWEMLKMRPPGVMPAIIRPEDRPPEWAGDWMRKRGIKDPGNLTKRSFWKLKKNYEERRAKGLAEMSAVEMLGRYGIQAWNLSQETAVKIQNAIAANRMQPLAPERLSQLMQRQPGEDDQ